MKIGGANRNKRQGFQFSVFDWDYSGYANVWKGSAIPQSLEVILATRGYKSINELTGDGAIASNHPQAMGAGIHVQLLIFPFHEKRIETIGVDRGSI